MRNTVRLPFLLIGIVVFIILSILLWRDLNITNNEVVQFAKLETKATFNKDFAYRRWASSHGGVYVPIDSATPPNPYLSVLS